MKNKGFTLIELLIVIAIIALLASIGIPAIQSARRHALVTSTHSYIKGISQELETYFMDNGKYPPDTGVFGKSWVDACQDSTADDPYSLHKYLTFAKFEDQNLVLLSTIDTAAIDDPEFKVVVDTWGNPLVYENQHEHFKQGRKLSTNIDVNPTGPFAHRPDTYEIYSVGPDLEIDAWLHNVKDDGPEGQSPVLVDDKDELDPDTGDEPDDIFNW